MKRANYRLRILSLFIAVLAINFHMIIPHDHHLAELCSEQDEACPVSKNHSGHHTGMPIHCHACNDLTSEKAVNLIVLKHTHNIFTTGSIPLHCGLEPEISVAALFEKDIIFSCYESQDITSLRAPPSLS